MKGIRLFAGKAAQRAIARSIFRSEQREKQELHVPYTWCKDDCACYRPECAAHGCMDAETSGQEG